MEALRSRSNKNAEETLVSTILKLGDRKFRTTPAYNRDIARKMMGYIDELPGNY